MTTNSISKKKSREIIEGQADSLPFSQNPSDLLKYLQEHHPVICYINTDKRMKKEDVLEHMHADLFQLTCYTQGSGKFNIFGRKYDIENNVFFIMNPKELHQIRPEGKVPLSGISCRFRMPGFSGKLLAPAVKVESRQMPEAEMLLKKVLAEAVMQTDKSMVMASFLLSELLMLLDETHQSGFNDSLSEVVRNGILFMNGTFRKNITIDDVASRSGVTTSHFCRTFKKDMGGISPLSYLRKLRLGYAAERLFTSRDKISSIAANSGFKNAKNLNMAFRQVYGMSTQEFRRKRYENVPIGISPNIIERKISDS
ncbi:MAG TPA: hypothetical protein DCZ94_02155 [Lentisphaeria bacterium]|nr:MAG: hypothetical protein A2X48_19935 [Lentisphaerae bacterium GWF2_49_21]HBC85737.1 hypothetical protein [Lentisphaeria bacterium]